MGLLDSLAGSLLGGMTGGTGEGQQDLVAGIGKLLQQVGGVEGLMRLFQEKGLGDQVASWIGSGPNMQISGQQLHSALGSDQLSALAEKMGMTPEETSSQVAQALPQVVDRLTPNGQLPDLSALSSLLGKFG